MTNIEHFITDIRAFLNQHCHAYDEKWITRRRLFDTQILFTAILALVMERSTASYRLLPAIASFHNRVLGFLALPRFSPAAFSTARKKLSPDFFMDVVHWIYRYIVSKTESSRWFGRQVFAIDATKVVLPKELEADGFDDMGSGSYYPLGMVTTLFDLQLAVAYDCVLSQHTDERADAAVLLASLPEGCLLIGDRGYFSFELLYEAQKQSIDLLLRVAKGNAPVEIRDFFESNAEERIVTVTPSLPTERKIRRSGLTPQPVTLRLVSYWKKNQRFVLATSITNREIKASDLQDLYHSRWDIEEHFKFMKQQLELQKFRSRNLDGVLQELFASILLATITQAVVVLEKGPKSKQLERFEYSLKLIVGSIRKVLLNALLAHLEDLRDWVEAIRDTLKQAKSRFRPDRSYPRQSYKPAGRWVSNENGVRC